MTFVSQLFIVSSFLKLIFIGVSVVDLQCCVRFCSTAKWSSCIYIFSFLESFPIWSLQSNEKSYLCYTVGSYWLPILHIVMCIFQSQSPNLLPPPFSFGNHKFVFYICDYYVCFVKTFICTIFWFHMSGSSVQLLSHVWLFETPWTASCKASLSINNFQSSLRLISIESVMPSNHLILCCPLLPPSVFPSIGVFSNESVLHIRWPKCWSFSFSISPSNEYSGLISWKRWTGLISLHSKGLSRVSSNTTVQKHQFFNAQLSLQSNSHIHTWPLEKS